MDRLLRIWFLLGTVLPLILRTRRRPVLFVRQGALGDIICTFPAAMELKKRHPKAAFIYSCQPAFGCLPVMAGITTHITAAHVASDSRWKFLFAAVYHFSYNTEIGGESLGSIIEEFCLQFGLATSGTHPKLEVNSSLVQRAKSKLKQRGVGGGPLVALHPGPSWPVKEWLQEEWAILVVELQNRGFANIVLLGGGNSVSSGAAWQAAVPGIFSFVDQLTVEETVAVVSLCDLLIGIDSGLMHIAASVRTRAVGLFGPTSPRYLHAGGNQSSFVISKVECQGCHHRIPRLHWMTDCPHDIQCMKTISVKDVLEAVLRQLDSAQVPPSGK